MVASQKLTIPCPCKKRLHEKEREQVSRCGISCSFDKKERLLAKKFVALS